MADLSKNKYTELLVFIILFLLALALLDERGVGELIASSIFLCVIISIIRKIYVRRVFALSVGCGVIGFLLEVVADFKLLPHPEEFLVVSNCIYLAFIFIAILSLGKRLYAEKRVTIDTIRGGFCIYLFIGTAFFLVYDCISLLDPKAFFYAVERKGLYNLMYYSFTTLTTLGYGGIVPLNKVAMVLANLESVFGQLFPAVYIAKLVSLYSIEDIENQEP
ncbi:MAG: two pore domain potassium channel family protein [Chroococcidiopsidaceae cyanobacterium CP_BM_ER_R8_30]|nr:two pore domain potassium channel family protein [Chroococcidiopsidaceae cyanobacterium CP_BM_ER_R8_30]